MKKSLITLLALVIILTTAITGYAAAPNRATYLPSAGSVAIVRDIDLGTGERVIIVMGAINALVSRVSGTLNKYISCIA